MSVIPVIEIALNQSYEEDDSINSSSIYSKNYWALLLLILCILVVFGNVLVILSVAKERSLQNITNFFIVSLAIADLCVAGVVMPFYAYTLVRFSLKSVKTKRSTTFIVVEQTISSLETHGVYKSIIH